MTSLFGTGRSFFFFFEIIQRHTNRFHDEGGKCAGRALNSLLHLVDDVVGETNGFRCGLGNGRDFKLLVLENFQVSDDDERKITEIIERRAKHEPIQYILGVALPTFFFTYFLLYFFTLLL